MKLKRKRQPNTFVQVPSCDFVSIYQHHVEDHYFEKHASKQKIFLCGYCFFLLETKEDFDAWKIRFQRYVNEISGDVDFQGFGYYGYDTEMLGSCMLIKIFTLNTLIKELSEIRKR